MLYFSLRPSFKTSPLFIVPPSYNRYNKRMPFKYESIVPWGRSYQEYIDMFNLTIEDLNRSILGCRDGPSSFNSIKNKNGRKAVSIDPLYQFTKDEIKKRINDTYSNVINQTRDNQDKFIWTNIRNIDELVRLRMSAMEEFLKDYDKGKAAKRYVFAELPKLPFKDDQFDLALSAHFLLFYSDNLTLDFHKQAIDEMLRVAKEVRIFPLVDVNAERLPYVEDIIGYLRGLGRKVAEEQVKYEFQKGGNTMLKVFGK